MPKTNMPRIDEYGEMVSMTRAMELLDVSKETILRYIDNGRIRAQMWASSAYMLRRDDVDRLVADPPKKRPGRPKKPRPDQPAISNQIAPTQHVPRLSGPLSAWAETLCATCGEKLLGKHGTIKTCAKCGTDNRIA